MAVYVLRDDAMDASRDAGRPAATVSRTLRDARWPQDHHHRRRGGRIVLQ